MSMIELACSGEMILSVQSFWNIATANAPMVLTEMACSKTIVRARSESRSASSIRAIVRSSALSQAERIPKPDAEGLGVVRRPGNLGVEPVLILPDDFHDLAARQLIERLGREVADRGLAEVRQQIGGDCPILLAQLA